MHSSVVANKWNCLVNRRVDAPIKESNMGCACKRVGMASQDIYSRNHGRPIGNVGMRRLILAIATTGRVREELSLRQHWKVTGNVVMSRVVVEPPSPLAGTEVEIVETRKHRDLQICVRIPGSTRTFSPGPDVSEAFVFGSDFTYEDFRFFMPPGSLYKSESTLSSAPCWQVRYNRCSVRHIFEEPLCMPSRHVWSSDNTDLSRTVISSDFRDMTGIVMPGLMVSLRATGGYESRMSLREVEIER